MLLPVRTVGVMGDYRTYDSVCGLRAVTSVDGMTADVYPFDGAFLARVATRIVNEVQGINRVVYDYTSSCPARSSGVIHRCTGPGSYGILIDCNVENIDAAARFWARGARAGRFI